MGKKGQENLWYNDLDNDSTINRRILNKICFKHQPWKKNKKGI